VNFVISEFYCFDFLVAPKMLACLAPSLTRLNLSYNGLTKMGSSSIYPSGLKHLDLSHNEIDTWPGEQRTQPTASGDICYGATLNSIYEEKQSPTSTTTSNTSSTHVPENRKLLRLHHSKLAGKMERQGSGNMLLLSPEKSAASCSHKKHTRLESLRTLILSDNNLRNIFVHCGSGLEVGFEGKYRRLSSNEGRNDDLRLISEKKKNTSEKSEKKSEKKSSQKSGSSSGGTGNSNAHSSDLKAVKLRIMFPMLSMLDVSNNRICEIPSTIHELSNLSVLNVSGNTKIVDLPPQMGLLQKLWNLNTRGCTLQEPLATMMSSKSYKTSDVIGYLRSILENSKPYARLKLMVVGIQGNKIKHIRYCKLQKMVFHNMSMS
jgi:Leucine-rich repeat (LRR) protein